MRKYTIELTEYEMIKYYANKIIEDYLKNCSEFNYVIDSDEYENSNFIEEHKEEILNKISKDERVAEVYLNKENNLYSFNITFWLDYCPNYYEENNLSLQQEKEYLELFIKKMLKPISDNIITNSTRNLIRTFMDKYIEPSDNIDFDTKDDIYNCIKEHICKTGFNEKYIEDNEVYIDKDNIKEFIKLLNKEIEKINLIEFNGIKQISTEELNNLINKYENDFDFINDELDIFICKDGETYLGIDNRNGELYIEEFKELNKCKDYLMNKESIELDEEEFL